MDNRAEVREFLISRRAGISPAEAGLPQIGARRVPGLRRGEVATLAGVSVEHYAKLERGAIAGMRPRRRPSEQWTPRPSLQWVLDRFTAPAITHNARYHGGGTKTFHHRDVGDLALAYESMDMISDPGLTLTPLRRREKPTPDTPPSPVSTSRAGRAPRPFGTHPWGCSQLRSQHLQSEKGTGPAD